MSFSQNLVLWLHVAFVAFTIGPVTLAIMSTPRYIRHRDVRIVRYLNRMTVIFAFSSLGVLVAGMALASMKSWEGKWWVIVSATLFLVALLLVGLIVRDQRKAIKALEEGAGTGTPGGPATGHEVAAAAEIADSAAAAPDTASGHGSVANGSVATSASQIATVERGRIAMTGGVVSLIWLVILVLMVWQ